MLERCTRLTRWFADWHRFCTLLTIIFLVRGVFLLSILPPFEGWDEYQHIAYIEFVCEHGRSPILQNGDTVPRSLYEKIVQYPHSRLAIDQLREIGALSYDDFWASDHPPAVKPDAPALRLYQAQQSPLYYRLVAPLYRWLDRQGGILAAVTGLRALNILFGAGAIYCVLWAVGRLVKPGAHRYVLGLLIALQPLYLLNCARVANDALAVLLGTLSVSILLVSAPHHFQMASFWAGITLGLGILSKTIDLSLIPFVVFACFSYPWSNRKPSEQSALEVRSETPCGPGPRPVKGTGYKPVPQVFRCALGLAICTLAGLAVCGHYFWFNIRQFGMLTPLQEAISNRHNHQSVFDLLSGLDDAHWWRAFRHLYMRYSLWFGGWSWLISPTRLLDIHQVHITLSILGGCFALWASVRRRACLFLDKLTAARLVVLSFGVAAGLGYHALHTYLAYGAFAANSWYAAISFPWLLCLFYQAIACFPSPWITRLIALSMASVYVVAELDGTLVRMVYAYTGHGWDDVAWNRLSVLHLPGLGPTITFPTLGLMLIIVIIALAVWVGAMRRPKIESRDGLGRHGHLTEG